MRCTLLAVACVALAFLASPVLADTNANCTYGDALGTWQVYLTESTVPQSTNCTNTEGEFYMAGTVTFTYPNIVTDQNGNVGNWTLIYNQGVEWWMGENSAVNFFFFGYTSNDTTDYCDVSEQGWSRSNSVGLVYQCMYMQRQSQGKLPEGVELHQEKPKKVLLEPEMNFLGSNAAAAASPKVSHPHEPYRADPAFLEAVNKAQNMFTVKDYGAEFSQFTRAQWQKRRGGATTSSSTQTLASSIPPTAKPLKQTKKHRSDIPESWDWRSIGANNTNYVSPVRDQGQCGSCYSFGSAGMMEARIRIFSNNEDQPIISTQDIVSCSWYSQGCEGGFPYLAAGKYGHEFGLAEEACYPYVGLDEPCNPNPQPGCNPNRWFTNEYYYIGGYYGQSTVQLMQEEIMANGPIAVSFEVYDDFMHYSGGVYTHQFTRHLSDSYNPFALTNHVVTIVGWGVTLGSKEPSMPKGDTPYWIVKNSWGTAWGEQGYFRILRGSSEWGGECAIESITVSAIPILH